jgi:hypothetical protein
MLKYNNKADMVKTIFQERQRLQIKLDQLTPEELCRPGAMSEWSVKDILMHLVDWEQRVIRWYHAGKRGEKPHIPEEGKTWRDLPEVNRMYFLSHLDMTLADVLGEFEGSYTQMLALIETISEEEMFTPGWYPWTGKLCLGEYVASSTHKHYDWARKEIRPAKIRELAAS